LTRSAGTQRGDCFLHPKMLQTAPSLQNTRS
jgi:hypothetical protein